jgi:hypothetical protein
MSEAKVVLSAVDKTQAAFESAKQGLQGLHTKAVAVSGALAGIGVTAFVADMTAGVRQALNEWDELGKAAQRAGFQSAQGIAEFQFAAKLAGVDASGFETAVGKLSDKLADAASGGKSATALFSAMGVRIKDVSGNLRDTEAIVTDLAKAFSGWRDGPEKTALALELFGKQGKQLIPLLNGGAEGMDELRREFRLLRGTLDEGTIKSAEHFNDNLTKLETAAGGLKRELAEALLPSLNKITDAMVEEAKKGNALLAVWNGLKEAAKGGWVQALTPAGLAGAAAKGALGTGKPRDDREQIANLERLLSTDTSLTKQERVNYQAQLDAARGRLGALRGTAGDFARLDRSTLPVSSSQDKPPAPTPAKDGGGAGKESAYASINKTLVERLALQEQELAQGRALSEMDKLEIKILEDLKLSKVAVTAAEKADIAAKIAKAKANESALAVLKSEQHNAAEEAKFWAKTQAELDAAARARTDERNRLVLAMHDENGQLEDTNELLKAEASLMGAT